GNRPRPDLLLEPDLLVERQRVIGRMEVEIPTAGGDLGGDRGRVGEAHPEDAAVETSAVAVDEFRRELRFAAPAERGRRGGLDLADGGGLSYLELAGQHAEILLPSDEERIDRKRHPRAGRQRPRSRDRVDRKIRDGMLRHRARERTRRDSRKA